MRLELVFGCVVDGRCMTLVELRVANSCPVHLDILTCFVWLRFGWRLHCSSGSDFFQGCLGWSGKVTVAKLVGIPISLVKV